MERQKRKAQLFPNVNGWRLAAAVFLASGLIASAATPVRERLSFNSDWRFIKEDPEGTGDKLSYANITTWLGAIEEAKTNTAVKKPADVGADVAYTRPEFDDSGWRKLNLPHDWGVEGQFKQEYPGETGKLAWWGVGWYRKHFDVPMSDKGRQLYLDVDGAMSYATVWVNGQYVGRWPYGYASWRMDLTPFVKYGADNVVAIRLDNPQDSSRWYPGGGIYRNVWLVKNSPVHVGQWGTYVTTAGVTKDLAKVSVQVHIENHQFSTLNLLVKNAIYELDKNGAKGALVEGGKFEIKSLPGNTASSGSVSINVINPKLWSLAKPNQYVVVTRIEKMESGELLDTYDTVFGIRSLKFDAEKGFFLNGEHVRINGVCDHHDLGALGSAINVRAIERQLQILQEMGCNAIRTSHNPPAPELLDLCDRMGFLVMDEAFDCWQRGKKKNDYHLLFNEWHEQDWRAQIHRDWNHPSIILWSTGNEINEQGNTNGHAISAALTRIVHDEDPTRPATAACNNIAAGFNGFQNTVDVFGYNYKPMEYARFRETNSGIALFGSETASTVSSRGEYFFPVSTNKLEGQADFQVSSYDIYAPRWATTPDTEFRGQDENPFVCGEFVWTGFDYLGEPTPYNSDRSNLINYTDPADKARAEKELAEIGKILTPSRSSYFGIIDLAGFPKDRYYLYQARWRPDFPMAHILPHWNWPDRVGQVTPVHVYTSGDEAELFLNEKSLGRQKKDQFEYRLQWNDVVYQPGTLKVVAYKNGKKWATDEVKTTGPAAKLKMKADRSAIAADGKDLSFVTVTVADKEGLLVPRSKNHIRFEIQGPGEIVATDNGNPTSLEFFKAPEKNAFNGLALVIVRALPGWPGEIKLTAISDGLKSETVSIKSN
jgi:beta-galactosidase